MRLLVLVALLVATQGAAAEHRFVATKGESKVEVPPDFVRINMTLLATGPDLQRLKDDIDGRTERVLSSASELQIGGTDIESSGMRVTREYEMDRNDNETLRGYTVTRSVEIKLRAIDKYERLTQALIDAKVDTVEDVDVDVDDRSALKQRALVEAARNAREEAQAIASELGIELGQPLEVSEERLSYKTTLRERADDLYSEIVVTGSRIRSTPVAALVFRPHAIEVNATIWTRFEIVTKKSP